MNATDVAGPQWEDGSLSSLANRVVAMESNLALTTGQLAATGSVVQAVATVLTLAVAILAVRYTARQVREARAQVGEARKTREAQSEQARQETEEQAQREQRLREEQARPFVVVDCEPNPVSGNIIDIVFENVGKTLAKNVRFSFDPPLKSSQDGRGGYVFEKSVLLSDGIPAMPPGKRVVALFDVSHERVNTELPMAYAVRVDLQDFQGRDQETLEYVMDLNFRYGLRRVESKTIHDVAKSLESIERHIGR